MDFSISVDDQKKLLKYARDVIHASFYDHGKVEAPELSATMRCGAFVTLRENGSLRGCIGRMRSNDPLVATVSEMALAAAFEDPRFPSLKKEELALIDIEITALSPLHPIAPDEVIVGKHGLLISAWGRSGVLLPQVPTEYGWDRETFLEQVCRKAGLSPDTWKSSLAQLYGFEGFVFSES
ncbi:MAG: AmmeMemoRadiSam system protein A [Rectinema sp.]